MTLTFVHRFFSLHEFFVGIIDFRVGSLEVDVGLNAREDDERFRIVGLNDSG